MYLSSARRGLVIFHEHIGDLLSGGVSPRTCRLTVCVCFRVPHSPSVICPQGFLEQTYLFYGFYKVNKIHFPNMSYNLPLAYLLVTVGYLFLSLVWIVKRYREAKIKSCVTYQRGQFLMHLFSRSATGFKRNLVQDEDRFQSFCNKIFAGWDFCITNENAARLKRSSLLYELRVGASPLSNMRSYLVQFNMRFIFRSSSD